MSGKNCNHCSVFGPIQYTNPAKQANYSIFGSSSGFNMKLQHDWSNFDLPKLMPVEHITHFLNACIMIMVVSH